MLRNQHKVNMMNKNVHETSVADTVNMVSLDASHASILKTLVVTLDAHHDLANTWRATVLQSLAYHAGIGNGHWPSLVAADINLDVLESAAADVCYAFRLAGWSESAGERFNSLARKGFERALAKLGIAGRWKIQTQWGNPDARSAPRSDWQPQETVNLGMTRDWTIGIKLTPKVSESKNPIEDQAIEDEKPHVDARAVGNLTDEEAKRVDFASREKAIQREVENRLLDMGSDDMERVIGFSMGQSVLDQIDSVLDHASTDALIGELRKRGFVVRKGKPATPNSTAKKQPSLVVD
jgi:hypothetical protein